MKKTLRKLSSLLPTKLVLYIDYGRSYKKILNLNNPKYLGEKIQWIKLNGNLEKYGKYVDKYEVRKYVEEKIGRKYLNEVYGLYKTPEEIDFNKLPKKFVLKMTNGTGGNIICKDKSKLDIESTKRILKKWQKEKFYKYTKEMEYKNIESKIICERYLEDETGALRDYKFHCTSGQAHIIQVHTDRFTDHREDFYDLDWNDCGITCKFNKANNMKKPSKLEEMVSISEILSKDFPYVRVDLYLVKERIFFGELTFTPANGTQPFYPLEKDIEIASAIDLSKYNK